MSGQFSITLHDVQDIAHRFDPLDVVIGQDDPKITIKTGHQGEYTQGIPGRDSFARCVGRQLIWRRLKDFGNPLYRVSLCHPHPRIIERNIPRPRPVRLP